MDFDTVGGTDRPAPARRYDGIVVDSIDTGQGQHRANIFACRSD
jgi:hypothetical protein